MLQQLYDDFAISKGRAGEPDAHETLGVLRIICVQI